MTIDTLKATLIAQLHALEATDFPPQALQVWALAPQVREAIGAAFIRTEQCSWSWGHCRSETCAHGSHDPYQEGATVFFNARACGKNERGETLYQLPGERGTILAYRWRKEHGYHYAPTASLMLAT